MDTVCQNLGAYCQYTSMRFDFLLSVAIPGLAAHGKDDPSIQDDCPSNISEIMSQLPVDIVCLNC